MLSAPTTAGNCLLVARTRSPRSQGSAARRDGELRAASNSFLGLCRSTCTKTQPPANTEHTACPNFPPKKQHNLHRSGHEQTEQRRTPKLRDSARKHLSVAPTTSCEHPRGSFFPVLCLRAPGNACYRNFITAVRENG